MHTRSQTQQWCWNLNPVHLAQGLCLHHDAVGWFQILARFLQGLLGQVRLWHEIRVFNKFYSRVMC